VNDIATILLAEDLEDDIVLIRRALEKGGIQNPVQVVRDGEEAINYLSGMNPYSDRAKYPLPALLLLDLKMPKADGFEVLHWIQTQPYLKPLRTVVLTSSEDIRDVNRAYHLGASSFLVKPLDFENAVELAKTVTHYWLKSNMSSGPLPEATAANAENQSPIQPIPE
jgi:CheY-like chemotaxis protein